VDLPTGGTGAVTPFINLQTSMLWQTGYTEDGGGVLNMKVDGSESPSVRAMIGAKMRQSVDFGENTKVDVTARIGYSRELISDSQSVNLAFAADPQARFTLQGDKVQENSVVVGGGLASAFTDHVTGFVRYDGDLGEKDQTNTVSAGFRFNW